MRPPAFADVTDLIRASVQRNEPPSPTAAGELDLRSAPPTTTTVKINSGLQSVFAGDGSRATWDEQVLVTVGPRALWTVILRGFTRRPASRKPTKNGHGNGAYA